MLCRVARRKMRDVNPSQAFLLGLLHDIGKVALDAILPKSFARVVEGSMLVRGNIADLERNIIGIDHMVVGKRLAERWKLPSVIAEVIWMHGQMPSALPQSLAEPNLVNLVTLADQLVRQHHLGFSGNYTFLPEAVLLAPLNLRQRQMDTVLGDLVSRVGPRAKALGLGDTDSDRLYQHALIRANKELSRLGENLVAKNRRLAVRSKFFDTLSTFQEGLSADATAQTVLHAIGKNAIATIASPSVAAFSVAPGNSMAELVLVNPNGEVFDTTLIDVAAPLEFPNTGDGPVQAAGNELEWLVAAISPRLGAGSRFWISLRLTTVASVACSGRPQWGNRNGWARKLTNSKRSRKPGRWHCGPRRSAKNPASSPSNWPKPIVGCSRPRRNPAQQDDDHRRRDGRRRRARDEQPAGGDLRPIAVAGITIDGPQAKARRQR